MNILFDEKALKNVNNPSPIRKLLINEPIINTIDIGTICFCFPLNIKKEQNTINTDIAHGLNPSINPAIIIPIIEIFSELVLKKLSLSILDLISGFLYML